LNFMEGDHQAEARQYGCELNRQPLYVAGGGKKIEIDHPAEECVEKNTELASLEGHATTPRPR
jgi:hypothetical protein